MSASRVAIQLGHANGSSTELCGGWRGHLEIFITSAAAPWFSHCFFSTPTVPEYWNFTGSIILLLACAAGLTCFFRD